MKRFQNTRLSKNDKQIIKNFKLDREFRELSKEELDSVWIKILNYEKFESEKIQKKLKNFYKYLTLMNGYISVINGKEYFFFDFNEKNFYNICFFELDNYQENSINTLSNSRESIEIFKVICGILRKERNTKRTESYKIQLPNKFSKLYFKLIDKSNREVWKHSKMNIKRINSNYYYYYRCGNFEMYRGIHFLGSLVLYYKKTFLNINEYISKHRAR